MLLGPLRALYKEDHRSKSGTFKVDMRAVCQQGALLLHTFQGLVVVGLSLDQACFQDP
jgi:hypothetical protein